MNALACNDLEMRKRGGRGLRNAVCERWSGNHKLDASCSYDKQLSLAASALLLALSWKKAVNFMINYS